MDAFFTFLVNIVRVGTGPMIKPKLVYFQPRMQEKQGFWS